MAKECLIVGRPNVGKTLFLINFAEYLGKDKLSFKIIGRDNSEVKVLTPFEARKSMVSDNPHHTRWHQSVELLIPAGKGKKKVIVTDTGGLSEGIHNEAEVRRAMAHTIASIRTARLILHVMDTAALGQAGNIAGLTEIDYQLAQFARSSKSYIILANKIDLEKAEHGLDILFEEFSDVPVVPMSSLYGTGFDEVKKNVAKYI